MADLDTPVPGLLDRFNDFLSPTKVPDNALYDPQTLQMARAAMLGHIGATLLSASQKGQSYDQRAQTLGQLGKGPEIYAGMMKGGADDLYKRLQIMQLKSDLDRQTAAQKWLDGRLASEGAQQALPAGAAGAALPAMATLSEAGAPAPAGGGAPVGAVPSAGVSPANAYRLPSSVMRNLIAGGKKPTDIATMEAEQALKQETWTAVPPGDTPLRRSLGLTPTQPATARINPQGQIIDYKLLGDDPEKPPVGYRNTPDGNLEGKIGGPGERMPLVPIEIGETEERKNLGLSPTQPAVVQRDAKGRVIDIRLLGEDPEKPPAGFKRKNGVLGAEENGPATQLPGEIAGRMGIATNFLAQVPTLEAAIGAGKLTSATAKASIKLGLPGEATDLYRIMQSGSDALQRGLTGAGKGEAESKEYASRYLPTALDNAQSLQAKLTNLSNELRSINANVTRGRGGVPEPVRAPAPGEQSAGKLQVPNEPYIRGPNGEIQVVRNGQWSPWK